MTLFERILIRTERWIEAIDMERDLLVLAATDLRPGVLSPALMKTRLEALDRERVEALRLLEQLRIVRHHPALLFAQRPMLKARPRRKKKLA